jgi:hypothetical protein
MSKKMILVITLVFTVSALRAQYDFKLYLGAGYGLENRIGFRGISLHADGQIAVREHLQGVVAFQYFNSNNVPKWGEAENEGAYFRQVTAGLKLQFSSGEESGTGFLASAGLGIRSGKTYHFESGTLHNGQYTDHRFVLEKIRGNGIILGLGYGFRISEICSAKIEFNHFAFNTLNDMQSFSLKIGL